MSDGSDGTVFQGLRDSGIAIMAAASVLAGLVLGRSFLIPLAIALLLWTLLEAVIGFFFRCEVLNVHVPRWGATLLGLATILACLYVIGSILLGQTDAVANAWPRYAARWEAMAGDLSAWLGPERSGKLRHLMTEVDLKEWAPAFVSSVRSFLTSLLLVVAYTGFLLAEGRYLPSKIVALAANPGDSAKLTGLISNISAHVRSYVWIKFILSVMTGALSYAVLKMFRLDFAETWALLIFVLNFIPNIGSIIAVAFPTALALVQFDDPTRVYALVACLTLLQVLLGSVLEPILLGTSLNMSPFAIILSLAFWAELWGIVGMFLSVPIMVLVLIVCSHIPRWRWIAVLLSRDGTLAASSNI